MTWAERSEQGEAQIAELVVLVPLLVMFMLLMVALGRFTDARAEVDGAARDAARQASLARSPAAAGGAAQRAAEATLGGGKVTCRSLSVSTDTGSFAAGGSVRVDVACTVDLSDLALLALPGSQTVRGHFIAPIERFRGGE